MANKSEHQGLVASLATGMKDIPRNASWLLGKAMSPGGENGAANGGMVDSVRQAGSSLVAALPGQDSVDARLARARAATERAQQAEREALEAAQRAQELAAQAEEVQAARRRSSRRPRQSSRGSWSNAPMRRASGRTRRWPPSGRLPSGTRPA